MHLLLVATYPYGAANRLLEIRVLIGLDANLHLKLYERIVWQVIYNELPTIEAVGLPWS